MSLRACLYVLLSWSALAVTFVVGEAAAAAQAPAKGREQRSVPERSVPEIVERIREGRKLGNSGQRFGAAGDLTRIETEEARRAALVLFEEEDNVALRGRFLAHAAALEGLEDLMRRELTSASNAACAETAAAYLLARGGKERAFVLTILDSAKGSTAITQQQAVLLALASSKSAEDHALFSKKCKAMKPAELLRVFARFRSLEGAHIDELRRAALDDSYVPLRGAALEQLCAKGDEKARELARELADAKKPDAAMLRAVLTSLFAKPEREDLERIARLLESSHASIRNASWNTQLMQLAKLDFVEAWAIEAGAQHGDVKVRLFAARLLENFKSPAATDALFALTQGKEPELRRRAILELAKRKDMRVRQALEAAFDKGDLELRIDAFEGLAALLGDEPSFQQLLLELASAGPTPLRLIALDLGGKKQLRELLTQVPELLASKDWRLRAAGIQLARDVRAKESIPLLIAQLGKEEGRLAEDARGALASLTRLFYQDAKAWERWWQRDGASFVLPPKEEAPKPERGRGAGRNPGQNVGAGTSASFYGIPILSSRVVYCIDVSGSMSAKVGTGITRLEIAKGALLSALQSSPKKSLINVIFFENVVHPYDKKSVALDNKAKFADIEKFPRRQTPRGGTNIHGALVAALEDPAVDTVFLLSDGAPSAGEITDPKLLVEDIVRRNRSRRVVFHCISIGGDSAMMRDLAGATGGKYSQQ